MDTSQISGEKMEGFLALARSSRGRAAASIIADATATPGLYAFGELLDLPHIKELEGTEFASSLELLRLFAFGTLMDYKARSASLPPLSPAQTLKLKQLTVVSLAESRKLLPYSELAAALDVSCEGSVRELEDFIINECFNRELVKGKLDQQRRALEVHWALGRDLAPGALQTMVAQLAAWQATTESVVAKLGVRIAAAAAQQQARAKEDEQVAATLKEARRQAKAEMEVRGTAAGAAAGGLLSAHALGGGGLMVEDLLGMQDAMDDGEGDAVGDRAGSGRPKRRR